ncbi:MAG: twin-arginine translocase TatA/TatE family subunit [Pyrinomonadaceae bacterium]
MHSLLFVFEFLGTTELLVVAVVALILFGPRKLPEIGRTVGRGLAEFKRASDDFKRTWEYEVEIEQRKPALEVHANATTQDAGVEVPYSDGADASEPGGAESRPEMWGTPIARGSEEVYAGVEDVRAGGAQKRADEEDEINAS